MKICDVRWKAADALGTVFSQVPDKDQAWQDLLSLTQDEDFGVRVELQVLWEQLSVKSLTKIKPGRICSG